MLIDLRNKNITGKEAEAVFGAVHITANKNMVPFDSQSPFVTSGIRLGTPAVTSRGLVESDMHQIADWIQEALVHKDQTAVLADIANRVKGLMEPRPLFVG
jgi:glycine hydroxymethyltransferase